MRFAIIEIERDNQKIIGQLAKHRQSYPGNMGITTAVYAEFIFGYFHQKKEELEKKGKPIPVFDLVTASCVLAQGATLITLDQHFRNVSGLKVIFLEEY